MPEEPTKDLVIPSTGDTRITSEEEEKIKAKLQKELEALETKTVLKENEKLKKQLADLEKVLAEKITADKEKLLAQLPEKIREAVKERSVDYIQGMLAANAVKQGLPLFPTPSPDKPKTSDVKQGQWDVNTKRFIPKRTVDAYKK